MCHVMLCGQPTLLHTQVLVLVVAAVVAKTDNAALVLVVSHVVA